MSSILQINQMEKLQFFRNGVENTFLVEGRMSLR